MCGLSLEQWHNESIIYKIFTDQSFYKVAWSMHLKCCSTIEQQKKHTLIRTVVLHAKPFSNPSLSFSVHVFSFEVVIRGHHSTHWRRQANKERGSRYSCISKLVQIVQCYYNSEVLPTNCNLLKLFFFTALRNDLIWSPAVPNKPGKYTNSVNTCEHRRTLDDVI